MNQHMLNGDWWFRWILQESFFGETLMIRPRDGEFSMCEQCPKTCLHYSSKINTILSLTTWLTFDHIVLIIIKTLGAIWNTFRLHTTTKWVCRSLVHRYPDCQWRMHISRMLMFSLAPSSGWLFAHACGLIVIQCQDVKTLHQHFASCPRTRGFSLKKPARKHCKC